MSPATATRGQSMQLGAILLFGFLVVGFTTAQATFVPAAVADAELDHSQQVADQLVELSTAVSATRSSGTPRPTTVTLGADYQPMPLFVYPPPGVGTLETTATRTATIENAASVTEPHSVEAYWNGSTRTYATRAISYRPRYRELDGTPSYRIEHGLLVTNYSGTTEIDIAAGRDPIIDGTAISLPLMAGNRRATGRGEEPLVVERVTDATTITVTNDGGPIRLRLPTTLSAATWREQLVGDESTVTSVTRSGGDVIVTLATSETYEITIHRIVAGTDASDPDPAYLRNTTATDWDYPFDVRNRYNDRLETPVTVWAYTEGNFATPNATVTIPTDPLPGLTGAVCYTIQRGVTAATRPETYGSPTGSCQ